LGVQENLFRVRERIGAAAARAGRSPDGITLVAVTKTVPTDRINEAVQNGVKVLGENRPQELMAKYELFAEQAKWHLIGHLQTNKVNKIVDKVAMIHSLDSIRLAETISRTAVQRQLVIPVLIQVNVAGEDTKQGIAPVEATDFLTAVAAMEGLKVCGLMTIAPWVSRAEEVRPVFRQLRLLSENLKKLPAGKHMEYLSMGMSGDYEVAVEEGANIIRIGTAIFGE